MCTCTCTLRETSAYLKPEVLVLVPGTRVADMAKVLMSTSSTVQVWNKSTPTRYITQVLPLFILASIILVQAREYSTSAARV
jgi:hypothetical protein